MALSTKLLSALVFLVLLAPAYSDFLSSEQPATHLALAHSASASAIKEALTIDAYQRADISSSMKKSTSTGAGAPATIDKQAVS